jgi:hypothetical protein
VEQRRIGGQQSAEQRSQAGAVLRWASSLGDGTGLWASKLLRKQGGGRCCRGWRTLLKAFLKGHVGCMLTSKKTDSLTPPPFVPLPFDPEVCPVPLARVMPLPIRWFHSQIVIENKMIFFQYLPIAFLLPFQKQLSQLLGSNRRSGRGKEDGAKMSSYRLSYCIVSFSGKFLCT